MRPFQYLSLPETAIPCPEIQWLYCTTHCVLFFFNLTVYLSINMQHFLYGTIIIWWIFKIFHKSRWTFRKMNDWKLKFGTKTSNSQSKLRALSVSSQTSPAKSISRLMIVFSCKLLQLHAKSKYCKSEFKFVCPIDALGQSFVIIQLKLWLWLKTQ